MLARGSSGASDRGAVPSHLLQNPGAPYADELCLPPESKGTSSAATGRSVAAGPAPPPRQSLVHARRGMHGRLGSPLVDFHLLPALAGAMLSSPHTHHLNTTRASRQHNQLAALPRQWAFTNSTNPQQEPHRSAFTASSALKHLDNSTAQTKSEYDSAQRYPSSIYFHEATSKSTNTQPPGCRLPQRHSPSTSSAPNSHLSRRQTDAAHRSSRAQATGSTLALPRLHAARTRLYFQAIMSRPSFTTSPLCSSSGSSIESTRILDPMHCKHIRSTGQFHVCETHTKVYSHTPSGKWYTWWAFAAFYTLPLWNIAIACQPLVRAKDDLADIPLTPAQRKLLGLPPSSKPATPDTKYSTPPRYSRTPSIAGSTGKQTPTSSPLSASGSPLLINGSPYSPVVSPLLQKAVGYSPRRSISQGSHSPLNASTFNASTTSFNASTTSFASSIFSEPPATPSPPGGKRSSVGLNNRWLYERSRKSSGNVWP